MRFPENSRLLSLALLGLACMACPTAKADDAERNQAKNTAMNERFDDLGKQFLDEYPALSPSSATTMGDHRFDAIVDDASAAGRDMRRRFYERWRTLLAEIDRNQLSRDRQVDFTLLGQLVERESWELDTLQEWAWNPIVYTQITGGAIYGLVAREFAPVEQRLKSVTARLEQYPRLYAQIRESLDPNRVPRVHAETAARQNKGLASILDNTVRPQLDKLAEADRVRLDQAMTIALAAMNEHQDWLDNTLVPQAKGFYQLGPELYEAKLTQTFGGTLTRQEIRERALAELQRTRTQMYAIARGVLKNQSLPESPTAEQQQAAIQAALELAYADVPRRDGIVDSAYESLRITTDFVKAKDLITLPDDPLEIIIMPEFQRGVNFAYCDSPGPLEVGQSTFYAVAPLPDDWTDEQVGSFLREYNIRSVHNLTVHEAMPGHFIQLAHSNRYPSRLRSLLSSGAFVEGWACYTEQMLSEEGFMSDDPLMRLITLKWYLRTAANALLDQYVHYDGMDRADAMKLMTIDAFQEESEAAGKWIRAQVTSAQLATYFVGFQQHRDLRETVEAAWGENFTLKRYHDGVVSFGSPPVEMVEALLLDKPIPE